MARRKPEQDVLVTLDDADKALARIATIDRALGIIDHHLNMELDKLKTQAKQDADPLLRERKELESGLKTFGLLKKEELFRKKKRVCLMHGLLGFRESKKVAPLKGMTWSKVLAALKELVKGTDEERSLYEPCVRSKEDVNREALHKLTDEQRAFAGVALQKEDEFYYEIEIKSVGESAA